MIVRVQLGFVMQQLGKEKEAATIYNQVDLNLVFKSADVLP